MKSSLDIEQQQYSKIHRKFDGTRLGCDNLVKKGEKIAFIRDISNPNYLVHKL